MFCKNKKLILNAKMKKESAKDIIFYIILYNLIYTIYNIKNILIYFKILIIKYNIKIKN